MNPGNSKLVQLTLPTTAVVADAHLTSYVDTRGYDYLQINILELSASAATAAHFLQVREDDTVPTAVTSMSAIVAFTGASATSTSAGFVLPTPVSAGAFGNVYRFNINLKGRKRYIGLEYAPGVSQQWCAHALLMRCQDGPAQSVSTDATATTLSATLRLNVTG
jgi:hypothetical protein